MTGKERKKAAQKARKKLVRQMDENIERAESRAGSRMASTERLDQIDLNAKQAGAEFAMDQLTQKLNGNKTSLNNFWKIINIKLHLGSFISLAL